MIPFERYGGKTYHEDPETNARFSDWDYMDAYMGWGSGASACGVLGFIQDVVGFASLRVYNAQTPLVSGLLELGEASPVGEGGYFISGITDGCKQLDQALRLEEAAAQAAQEVFERHYPEHTFGVYTRWD